MTIFKEAKVKIANGDLLGSYEKGIFIFKGIPYATPPIGILRWMPPQPPASWLGLRPALSFSPIAPQNASNFKRTSQFVINELQSEDCLYLNIWSPGLDELKRPVLVWLHGGAFTLGSGSQPDFSGNILAKNGDVVIVTLNYRLGLLGFLNLKEITNGEIPATGNEGLLDQIAALKWIRNNISVFGGDPANVTLFGESAGAMCIACLMAVPQVKGLFHKVISQSGGANRAKPLDQAVSDACLVLKSLDHNNRNIKTLKELTTQQLLSIQKDIEMKIQAMTIATPVIDGNILTESPIHAIKKGSSAHIPMLIGSNLEEWKLFNPSTINFKKMDNFGLAQRLSKFVPTPKIYSLIEAYRLIREKQKLSSIPADLYIAIKSDHDFRIPTIRLAEAQNLQSPSVFCYLFNWQSPDETFGSCHSLEIGFVFGTFNNNPKFYGFGPFAEKLSRIMQDAWIAFTRTGNPSCISLGNWPVYGSKRITQFLGANCHLEESPYNDESRLWDTIPENYSLL